MDKAFDNLVQEYVDYLVEKDPIVGTVLGLHQYDHLLPEGSRDAVLADIEKHKEFLRRFEDMDPNKLDPYKRIERDAMLQGFSILLFWAKDYPQWESSPTGVSVLGSSLFRLFAVDFAPLEERLRSITSRLEKAGKYLEDSKSRITKPVRLWVEIEIESSKRFPSFLDEILAAGSKALPPKRLSALKKAISDAKNAVTDYERWMESLLPKAGKEYRLGERRFRKLVRLKNLGLTVEEIRALGEDYLGSTKRKLEELAEQIKPGATVEDVRDMIKSNHPKDFDQVIKEYRESVKKSKRFVVEKKLVKVPRGEELRVIETPAYLRNTIPFAAYLMPGRFDKKQIGIYLVTPVEDNSELLKEHSYAGIMNTSVHEGYPGHHLQLVMANMNPSMVPLLLGSAETVEGWAHYCEDWMKERGFDDRPEARFAQTIDLVWRAARIIVDVDLHTKRMSMEEAVDFMVEQIGMERPSALAEVKRYTMNPAYQLCYLIGKHLIIQLRNEVKRRMGQRFTDAFFHNTLLSAGSLPTHLLHRVFDCKLREIGL